MMKRRLPVLVASLTALAAVCLPVWSQATIELAANDADKSDMASGEVRRIQADQSTITLKHGPISSISMPPMTMTFKVRDPALLGKVKVGDKVLFRAEVARDGTTYVTALDPVR
jgi:Cu(I)/Ag(I) efflux system periplasmic protein CusF